MLVFLLATVALVVANLVTDHEAQREGLNELMAGYRFGS
jgi:hypothetical protein